MGELSISAQIPLVTVLSCSFSVLYEFVSELAVGDQGWSWAGKLGKVSSIACDSTCNMLGRAHLSNCIEKQA